MLSIDHITKPNINPTTTQLQVVFSPDFSAMHVVEMEGRNQAIEEGKPPPSTMGTVTSSSARSPPPPYSLLPEAKPDSKKLKLLPLIFLIYFEVSGGPFGEEPAVKAAGPLFAILGFLVFPFIWSIPEALITAELATAYPGNGGYVIWADAAFGPFWGFQMGASKFLSGVINNAAYPVLCVDYMKLVLSVFASGWPRGLAISVATMVLSFLNYTGLTIVGYTAVALAIISICPFILMALFSIPKLRPQRWISLGQTGIKKDWNLYFNTLFWNLNFWDNASTLAGEVDKPQKTFPKALFSAGMIACIGYLIPLFAATGALDLDQNRWEQGFLADAAGMIAGEWLKFWVLLGAFLSTVGLFQAQLSSSSFQLLGMADLGFLPKIFALRSTWFNTPWVGILCCSAITLGVSYMDFTDIISSANFLYSLGMLLEFASFLWLRRKHPNLDRPYKVPLGVPAMACMLLVPTGFLIYVMAIATKIVYIVSASLILLGVLAYYVMRFCKSHTCLEFNKREEEEIQKMGTEVVEP